MTDIAVFEELLDRYFDIAVQQGLEGRDHDDEQGSAQETLRLLRECFMSRRLSTDPAPVAYGVFRKDGGCIYLNGLDEDEARRIGEMLLPRGYELKALYMAAPAPTVEVARLVWKVVPESDDRWLEASTGFGVYRAEAVETDGGSKWRVWSDAERKDLPNLIDTLEAAQEAAQTDFEIRVRASLLHLRGGEPVTLTYTNWRHETADRSILPLGIWFGSTDWHPEKQWFLKAVDARSGALRDFALRDFGSPVSEGWIDEMARKHASPDGTDYQQGAWDMAMRVKGRLNRYAVKSERSEMNAT